MFADTVYINGRIYTMECEGEATEAFAVRDHKILAVGATEEISSIACNKIVDLKGRTVLPGFIDAHLHLLAYGAGLLSVELRGTESIAEVSDLLRKRALETPKGEWIRGLNFDQERFREGRMPTREDLDTVSTEHPILISRYCQHVHVANSLALEMAGIDRTFAAADELCKTDERGEPNGILWDTSVSPILGIIPDPIAGYEAKKRAAREVCRDMARYGITGAHTVRGRHVDLDEYLNIYQDLEDEGHLPVRIYASFDEFPNLPFRTGLGNEKVRYGYYKIYVDGSLGGRGAYFSEPYNDAPEICGAMIHTPEEIEELVRRANNMGLQIGVHCIGDKAIECVVSAIEKAYAENPRPDARFRLIHVLGINKELIERCKKLPVMFDIQPKFLSSDVHWAEDRLGPERSSYGFAWKKLIDAGFVVTGSSDCPVEPYNPFLGIYAAVTRQDLDGWPEDGWYPENKLSVYEALSLYTKNGAYASFEENLKGTIAPGKLADFIVIDADPYQVPPEKLKDIQVLETYLGGENTYCK
ncbi:amidohydrolase [Oscillibacter valericigenes]|nr:amidohydrolase [Oscillibacter valericigenes]